MSSSRPQPLSGKDEGSFAYITIKDRLPETLTKVIDLFSRLAGDYHKLNQDEKADDAKKIVSKLSKLKNELQTDKVIAALSDDKEDTEKWNLLIKNIPILVEGKSLPTWYNISWLNSECYFYRKIMEVLHKSNYHHSFDPFEEQKTKTFYTSMEPLKVLSSCTADILKQENGDETDLKADFELLLEYCLWGNKCDLSLTAGLHAIKDLEKSKEFKALLQHIISNHTNDVWEHLFELRNLEGGNKRIDFVLDNAGFELLTDLCFALFLIEKEFCSEIIFHVKSIPWFVSDAMKKDVYWTIDECINNKDGSEILTMLGKKWKDLFESNKFTISENLYWTYAGDYSELQSNDAQLYADLSKSSLIFFKGDLNYRKLVGDRKWAFTTPFSVALSGFQPTAVCSLRTLKADVVVGLAEGKSESVAAEDPDWLVNAKYGVIQFAK